MEVLDLLIGSADTQIAAHTEVVFIRDVKIQANIGPDAWGRNEVQPLQVSARIPFGIQAAGLSDSIDYALDYRQMHGAIRDLDQSQASAISQQQHKHIMDLAEAIVRDLKFPDIARLDVIAPKAILHSKGLALRFYGKNRSASGGSGHPPAGLAIQSMYIPCVIGILDEERLQKQPVIVEFAVFASEVLSDCRQPITTTLRNTFEIFEKSTFLTLEAFVTAFAKHLIMDIGCSRAVVSAHKPDIFNMAEGPGVQILRTREFFLANPDAQATQT